MIFRKHKAVIAAFLSVAMTVSALATTASAAGTRTKAEVFGEDTYAHRALSLYDDVVTKGQANGYLSSQTATGGFGIPYHSVEELIIEAPDYGHETTSEAMSYIAWIAAMHDALLKNETDKKGHSNDFEKAWATMEKIIPTGAQQYNFFENIQAPNGSDAGRTKSAFSYEYQQPEQYPGQNPTCDVSNPYYPRFKTAYGSDGGYYLMHWLADVDDWYGYGDKAGEGKGKFTFINSFQRGEEESCWETVPHPCIEDTGVDNAPFGLGQIFAGSGDWPAQWRYTNAPDAEDRTIQAVYEANLWGVGVASVSAKAGKMSDQLRNDMFDKYYQKMGHTGAPVSNLGSTSTESMHYLMGWYTSWGGSGKAAVSLYGGWKWQIGAAHMHEFYQNPLAAYAKLYDSAINSGMKATDATKDWETSLDRQLEFYEWLQSPQGPFAGGATNSIDGKYAAFTTSIPSMQGVTAQAKFHDMTYIPHPVYLDPGSNHWIGNQVWATQRLAELYYYTVTDGDKSKCNTKARLEKMLDKWVKYFVDGKMIVFDDSDHGYQMVESLDWAGQPDNWSGQPSANSGLSCTATAWASGDIGVVASMANTLIYYAKAKGVDGSKAHDASVLSSGTDAEKALYYATGLLDRMWDNLRDDKGIAAPQAFDADFIHRFFTQPVYSPIAKTLPTGGQVKAASPSGTLNGCSTFYDIRPQYKDVPMFNAIKKVWDENPSLAGTSYNATAINDSIGDSTSTNYHRFWHEGDEIMALGALAMLYPDVKPQSVDVQPPVTTTAATTTAQTTAATTTQSTPVSDTTTPAGGTTTAPLPAGLVGDVTVNGIVDVADIVLMAKSATGKVTLTGQSLANSKCDKTSSGGQLKDLAALIKHIANRSIVLPV